LLLKSVFGAVGLAAGLVGMALQWRWLVAVAIGLLAIAFVLRFTEFRADRDHI
jgi:hypothetical protein